MTKIGCNAGCGSAVLLWAGCGGEDSTVGPDESAVEGTRTEATLAEVSEVFAVSCAFSGCHGGEELAAGLSLEGDFAGRIVGVASEQRSGFLLVDPGNPNKSYLLMKVRGDDEIISRQMPPGNPLPAEQVEIIRAWIASGAKE